MQYKSRSFKEDDEITLRFEYPLWRIDESLDPSRIQTPTSKKKQREDEDSTAKILAALADGPKARGTIRSKTGMGRDRCEKLLQRLVDEGRIQEQEGVVRGNQTMLFALLDDESFPRIHTT